MIRLTEYSHGGGCGCKIAPGVLQEILKDIPKLIPDPRLLVGIETKDDAAVYRINDEQALVLTTDFFMPIVDDPLDFGRIAATNALSDIYAMGGTPILALAILGMPINLLPVEVIRAILAGGQQVCKDAGIPLAGGHSIDTPEPIFGLVAAGLINPAQIKRNATGQEGDILILTKPLGIGVMTTAVKKQQLSPEGYQEVLAVMTQLNRPGRDLAKLSGVHAMTDVTGFGLLGHLLELCQGSKLGARITLDAVPIMAEARTLAVQGVFPGAAGRNWEGYKEHILADRISEGERLLLADPQTSGGLLIAVDPLAVSEVIDLLYEAGFGEATEIGCLVADQVLIEVV